MNRQNKSLDLYRCVIQPGQVAFSQDPSLICSVCGNGVLVVLRDKIKKIGGIAHCIYPKIRGLKKPTNYHVDVAIHSLFGNLKRFNSVSRNMEAQLFGGGHLRGYEKKRAEKVVKNARKVLKKLDVNIISQDVGGSLGRRVIFNTQSGEVVVQKTRRIRQSDWVPEIPRQ